MADDKPKLDLWVKDNEIYVDEEVMLNEDAAKALKDLEESLAGDAEVQGFASNVMVDLPPINIKGNPIDVGPIDINPMIMIGMMMKLGEIEGI